MSLGRCECEEWQVTVLVSTILWGKAVFVPSAAMAGQPEVNRNQADHLVRLLSLAGQPAASHLPLHAADQLLQSPARGRKPTCPKHVSARSAPFCYYYHWKTKVILINIGLYSRTRPIGGDLRRKWGDGKRRECAHKYISFYIKMLLHTVLIKWIWFSAQTQKKRDLCGVQGPG